MSDIPKGFVCWNTDGIELIKSNVGELGVTDNFILAAVHEPMSFKVKKHLAKFAATTTVLCKGDDHLYRDKDILEIFNNVVATKSKNERKETFLVTVKGDAGSGKSHLVRWLYENVQELENTRKVWVVRREDQHLQVMRKFVDDLADLSRNEAGSISKAQELKARMTATVEQARSSPDNLVSEIYDALVSVLRFQPHLFLKASDKVLRERFLKSEKNQNKLPDLLDRRRFADHRNKGPLSIFLREVVDDLLGDDFSRLEGKRRADKKFDSVFVDSILKKYQKNILQSKNVEDGDFENLITELLTNTETVSDLLNEALEFALAKVMHLGQEDFRVVFAEVREEMARLGQQLLIFMEDFSGVSAGIKGLSSFQADLLAVFTDAKSEERAPLRIVMAMTPSLWSQLPENVQQRHEFSIDIEPRVENKSILPFLSRYLNISRSSFTEVEGAYKNILLTDRRNENWVPNACLKCPYKDDCHSTFGATDDGIGLYPLNKTSGGLLLEQVKGAIEVTNRVLVTKLRGILSSHTQIKNGEFPGQNVADLVVGRDSERAVAIANTNFAQPGGDSEKYKQLARYVQIWKGGKQLPTDSEQRVFDLSDYGPLGDGSPKVNPPIDVPILQVKKTIEFDQVALYGNHVSVSDKPPDFNNGTRVKIKTAIYQHVELRMKSSFGSLDDYRNLIGLNFSAGCIGFKFDYKETLVAETPLSPRFILPTGSHGKYVLWGALLHGSDSGNSNLNKIDDALSRACFSEYVLEIVKKLTEISMDELPKNNGPISSIAKLFRFVSLLKSGVVDTGHLELIRQWFKNDTSIQTWKANVILAEPSLKEFFENVVQLTNEVGSIIGLSETENKDETDSEDEPESKFKFGWLFQIDKAHSTLSDSPSQLLKSLFSNEDDPDGTPRDTKRKDLEWRTNLGKNQGTLLSKLNSENISEWHNDLTKVVSELDSLFAQPIIETSSDLKSLVQSILATGGISGTLEDLNSAVTSIFMFIDQREAFMNRLKEVQSRGPSPDSYLCSLIDVSNAREIHKQTVFLSKAFSTSTQKLLSKNNVESIKLEEIADLENIATIEKIKTYQC